MRDYPTREIFEDDYPNVKGTAIGEGDHELIVLVTKKVAEEDLDIDDIVPTSVVIDGESYVTDVVPVGIPHGHDAPMAETEPADHQDRHRPIPGGVSIGNSAVGAGTLGHAKLEHAESGDLVGLSNSHVAGSAHEHFQPAKMDGGGGSDDSFGTLREASELDPSETQTTDSALIDVGPDLVSNVILGIGELTGFGDIEPTFEYTYKKSGRTTGVTSADLRGRDAAVRVAYGPDTLRFEGCAVFGRMSAPGDSGSLIGVDTDDGFVATHLLFAGSDQATIAIPLDAVQDEHGELTVPGSDDSGGDSDPITWGEFRYQARTAGGSPAESVVDGDTYDLDFDLGFSIHKTDQRIRLLGIDTAERGTEDYDTHTQFAVDWFEEAAAEYDGDWPLIVDTFKDETGSFGRWLVFIQRKCDGEWIGDALTGEFGEDVRYEISEQLERLLQ